MNGPDAMDDFERELAALTPRRAPTELTQRITELRDRRGGAWTRKLGWAMIGCGAAAATLMLTPTSTITPAPAAPVEKPLPTVALYQRTLRTHGMAGLEQLLDQQSAWLLASRGEPITAGLR